MLKMFVLRCLVTVLWILFTATGSVSGVEMKAVGETVSFGPENVASVTSIIWKQKSSGGEVVKVIEWDEDGFNTPNPRFKNITTLNKVTGHLTIKDVQIAHSGEYTIEINSKEQDQKFILTVKEPVPKPVIKIERTNNPDVVYCVCEYTEKITWKNSSGAILSGSPWAPKGESLTVPNSRNPENFFTCTLKNDVSEKTSDPVKESELFKEEPGNPGTVPGIVGGVFGFLAIAVAGGIFLYKRKPELFKKCRNKPSKGENVGHDQDPEKGKNDPPVGNNGENIGLSQDPGTAAMNEKEKIPEEKAPLQTETIADGGNLSNEEQ